MRIASIITAAAGRVIGRSRASVPAVQVRADHHDLIALAPARDFADDIHRIGAVVQEFGLDFEFQLDRNLVIQQTQHAVVVFRRQHDGRRRNRILGISRPGGLAEHRAAAALAAAQAHRHRHSLVGEKSIQPVLELLAGALTAWTAPSSTAVRPAASSATLCRQRSRSRRSPAASAIRGHAQLGQLLVGVAPALRCRNHLQLPADAQEHDLALQLALVAGEIGYRRRCWRPLPRRSPDHWSRESKPAESRSAARIAARSDSPKSACTSSPGRTGPISPRALRCPTPSVASPPNPPPRRSRASWSGAGRRRR